MYSVQFFRVLMLDIKICGIVLSIKFKIDYDFHYIHSFIHYKIFFDDTIFSIIIVCDEYLFINSLLFV